MEDFIPLVAILSVFGTITAIAFGPTYLKFRERRETQETVRRAIDKGQPLPPEVLDALTEAQANRRLRGEELTKASDKAGLTVLTAP